jgi:hypothetical protein
VCLAFISLVACGTSNAVDATAAGGGGVGSDGGIHSDSATTSGEGTGSPVPGTPVLDTIVFGDESSEAAHALTAPNTESVAGSLGQSARRALPRKPNRVTSCGRPCKPRARGRCLSGACLLTSGVTRLSE